MSEQRLPPSLGALLALLHFSGCSIDLVWFTSVDISPSFVVSPTWMFHQVCFIICGWFIFSDCFAKLCSTITPFFTVSDCFMSSGRFSVSGCLTITGCCTFSSDRKPAHLPASLVFDYLRLLDLKAWQEIRLVSSIPAYFTSYCFTSSLIFILPVGLYFLWGLPFFPDVISMVDDTSFELNFPFKQIDLACTGENLLYENCYYYYISCLLCKALGT